MPHSAEPPKRPRSGTPLASPGRDRSRRWAIVSAPRNQLAPWCGSRRIGVVVRWRRRAGLGPRASPSLALIIFAAMLVRVPLTPLYAYLPGNALDEYAWKRWMQAIHQYGVLNVFGHANTDYVGYHWVLWVLSGIYGLVGNDYMERAPHPGSTRPSRRSSTCS